jgi:enediyne biosynthesis protein E5
VSGRARNCRDFALKFRLFALRVPLSGGAIGPTLARQPAMSVNYSAIRVSGPVNGMSAADARYLQIATLSGLLVLHVSWFDLGATPLQAVVTIAAALGTQYAFSRLPKAADFDWRSPLITGLSLSLLLRTAAPSLWVLAPALAIGSKFLLRWGGKHLFNPATFAIVTLLLLSPDVWVSPGQWGDSTWLVLLLVCSGGLVLQRAGRADTAIVFLGCYAGLLCWRAWSLGDPLAIPLNQLQSGALLLFSFFMITDPRSTPDHRLGRMLFAASVALLAYWLQFCCQLRPALFYALAAMSPLTPFIDRFLPAPRFTWRAACTVRSQSDI